MNEGQIVGAVIGAIVGFIVATAIASPRFTYLGGHWGQFEGGMGCIAGGLLRLVLIAGGAVVGAALASSLG